MVCKKCKKDIPNESLYCMWCGAAQKRDKKKPMYQRPDGLFEKIITINGERKAFRGKSEKEVLVKILNYEEKDRDGQLFKVVAEKWKDEHWETIASNTKKGYTPAYHRAIDEFGERYIQQIKPQDIELFLRRFAKKGFAAKTVRTQYLIIHLILSYAVMEGFAQTNPSEYVSIPKNLPKAKRELPDDKDIQAVKDGVDKPFGLFAYLLYYSGCRKGEALALQYSDIDREKKLIHINKSVYHETNAAQIKLPKTAAGIREVVLLDCLAKKIPLPHKGHEHDYIFSDTNGKEPLAHSHFNKFWSDYQKATGIKITPHQLRHAFATLLYEAEIDEKVAQEMLGHASISMTKDIYTHIRSTHKEKIANTLNEFTKIEKEKKTV